MLDRLLVGWGGTVRWLLLLVFLLLKTPAIAQDITRVPMTIDGETVSLAMRICLWGKVKETGGEKIGERAGGRPSFR